MKTSRNLLNWGVPIVISLLAGSCLFALKRSADQIDLYPIGGGRHEISPDGAYEAHASNMGYKENGDVEWYYEFEITDKADGRTYVEYRIRNEDQNIQFRGGSGRIFWAEDSRSVQIGDSKTILWSYTFPTNNKANKAEMATPRKPSD